MDLIMYLLCSLSSDPSPFICRGVLAIVLARGAAFTKGDTRRQIIAAAAQRRHRGRK